MSNNKVDILILDDSSMALAIMEKMLKETGLDVIYECNPNKALDLIKEKLPKLIFIDYLMPELSGPEVAIKFSEFKLFKHCSINLISGKNFTQNEIYSLMSLGYENIIKKPVANDVLSAILEEHFPGISRKVS